MLLSTFKVKVYLLAIMDLHQKSMMANYHHLLTIFLPFPPTLVTFSVFLPFASLVSSRLLLLLLLSLVFYKLGLITLALIAFPLIVVLQVWFHHYRSHCFCSCYCSTSSFVITLIHIAFVLVVIL